MTKTSTKRNFQHLYALEHAVKYQSQYNKTDCECIADLIKERTASNKKDPSLFVFDISTSYLQDQLPCKSIYKTSKYSSNFELMNSSAVKESIGIMSVETFYFKFIYLVLRTILLSLLGEHTKVTIFLLKSRLFYISNVIFLCQKSISFISNMPILSQP